MKQDIRQDIWSKYSKGKNYIDEKGLVDKTKKAWRFYLGDQWHGLETGGEVMPMYNYIKPTTKYKVSTVCQNKMAITFSDVMGRDDTIDIYKAMNIKGSAIWEKSDMDTVVWKTIKTAAIQGDSYCYWYDAYHVQLLDNVSVLLGDEQNQNIQEQPYIIIRERIFTTDAKQMAKENGVPEDEYRNIRTDQENEFQLDKNSDIDYGVDDGKCLSLIYFTKENGIVWIGRCTRDCMYEPMRPVMYTVGGKPAGKGLSMYPIVNFVWEDKPNNARGEGEVSQLIPNQIQINRLLAQRSIAVKQCAFPKLAYNVNAVNNIEDIDTIGAAIAVNADSSQAINQIVSYLNPAGLNGEGTALCSELLSTSRELAGASENILGQIDPTRVAASAIASLQEASAVTINEQVSKYERFVETTARLWWELGIIYSDTVEIDSNEDGEKTTINVTPEEMEQLQPEVRVDVSQDTAFSKESMLTRMDKLLDSGQVSLEEWIAMLPQNSSLPKSELLKLMEKRKVEQNGKMQEQGQEQIQDQSQEVQVGGNNELPEMQQGNVY